MDEVWNDIPGYEGWYQASSLGRVRSVDRLCHLSDGRKRIHYGVVLKPWVSKVGYETVALHTQSDCRKRATVHRLVWSAFNGRIPSVINHLDGCKTNNRISNLENTTYSGNSLHAHRTGLANNRHLRGAGNANSKLDEKRVRLIRKIHDRRGWSQRRIAAAFGVSHNTIGGVIRREWYSYI